jgi:cysteine-rich repeat protein
LRFVVDGGTRQEWSNEVEEWTEVCHDVVPGSHEFTWIFAKNLIVTDGSDGFYLDDVRFMRELAEACDDGNAEAGDGCSPLCETE